MHLNFRRFLAVALVASWTWAGGSAFAQTANQNQTGQNQAVLTQTGNSEAFAIERNANESVNAVSTNFLSKSSAPGTSGTSYGTVEGFGPLGGGGGSSSLNSLGIGGRGGVGGLGGFGLGAGIGLGGQFGNQFGGGGQIQTGIPGTASSTLPLRHRIRVDVAPSPRSITRISRAFATRLTRLPGLPGASSVDVTMEGQIAVLTGAVDSERTRDLVARLAMLEPGIAGVQNNLSVVPTAAPAASLLPPSR